jgi:PHD/YefM family antitoxin component YafN of YafNO toxin-antitoxin module
MPMFITYRKTGEVYVMYLDDYSRLALGRERLNLRRHAEHVRLAEQLQSEERQDRRSHLAVRQALRRAGGLAQARAR